MSFCLFPCFFRVHPWLFFSVTRPARSRLGNYGTRSLLRHARHGLVRRPWIRERRASEMKIVVVDQKVQLKQEQTFDFDRPPVALRLALTDLSAILNPES